MDFTLVCTSWIKEDDEKVLTVLQKSDNWLSAEELSEITGLPLAKVTHTLKLLQQQTGFSKGRKDFFQDN